MQFLAWHGTILFFIFCKAHAQSRSSISAQQPWKLAFTGAQASGEFCFSQRYEGRFQDWVRAF
jgi:hypothetical protein